MSTNKLSFKIRKPDDKIEIDEGSPYPEGDPDLQSTQDLIRSLRQNQETTHHTVQRMTREHQPFFFRRDEANNTTLLELENDIWGFYGLPRHSENHDIPSFPRMRLSFNPYYWPTNGRSIENQTTDMPRDVGAPQESCQAYFSPPKLK